MVYSTTSDASMFQTLEISNYMFSSTRMTIPLQVISVRRRLFISPYAILLVRTSSLLKDYCKLCTTCSHETCAPTNPMDFSATSIPQEALEFHLHGFIEKFLHLQLHLDSSLVDCLSSITLIPTHNTITSPQLAQLFVLHVFSNTVSQPMSLLIMVWNSYPLLLVLELHWTLSFTHFGISSERWWTNWMN